MADNKRPDESEGVNPDIDETEVPYVYRLEGEIHPDLIESGVIKIRGKIEEWDLEDVHRMFADIVCNGDFKSYLDSEYVNFEGAKDLAWDFYEMIYIAAEVIYRNYLEKEWAEQLPS